MVILLNLNYVVAGIVYSIASDAKALVHRGRCTDSSLRPHSLLDFTRHYANLLEVWVHLSFTALKDGLVWRTARDPRRTSISPIG